MNAGKGTRVERARMPLARQVVRDVAVEHGVCVRPVPLRRTDLTTGEATVVDVPCGATLASVCPSCAERKRRLRMAQCREGWHLTEEPLMEADPATDEQRFLATLRADLSKTRHELVNEDQDVAEVEADLAAVDQAIEDAGVRGNLATDRKPRRVRSTRRRQDAPDLPRKAVENRTIGKTFTTPDGKTFRPSLFLTLTCDTYGRVRSDGTPVNPASYDYTRAARDAVHFSRLVDRFVQNLRRYVGYDVQYFATVEPQKRLAPHLHLALRGTVSRADLRRVVAATYHQVWWPPADEPKYVGDELPIWDHDTAGYVDPATGELLPAWDQALDQLSDQDAEPLHVARFGPQINAQGVLAGTPDADRCLRYLAKYLTKSLTDCHTATTQAQTAHVDHLADALRYEPCSPTCANWLRYGIQPKNARAGLRPGCCKSKAHKRQHLGYAGRRVLVSRKWSGKTLTDHRADRRTWVLETLGITNQDQDQDEQHRYAWAPIRPDDQAVLPLPHRLLLAVAERARWRTQLDAAQARASGQQFSATEGRAA